MVTGISMYKCCDLFQRDIQPQMRTCSFPSNDAHVHDSPMRATSPMVSMETAGVRCSAHFLLKNLTLGSHLV